MKIYKLSISVLLSFFIQQPLLATPKDIFTPKEIDYGIEFIPENGESYHIQGVVVPTASNFFIYESGQPYMTHVEKSKARLRKIDFLNGVFFSNAFSGELNKPLEFKLSYVHSVIEGQSEISKNCNIAVFSKTTDSEKAITIPNYGTIKYAGSLEFMNCNKNNVILIGTLFCLNSGSCEQQLYGIAKK